MAEYGTRANVVWCVQLVTRRQWLRLLAQLTAGVALVWAVWEGTE